MQWRSTTILLYSYSRWAQPLLKRSKLWLIRWISWDSQMRDSLRPDRSPQEIELLRIIEQFYRLSWLHDLSNVSLVLPYHFSMSAQQVFLGTVFTDNTVKSYRLHLAFDRFAKMVNLFDLPKEPRHSSPEAIIYVRTEPPLYLNGKTCDTFRENYSTRDSQRREENVTRANL